MNIHYSIVVPVYNEKKNILQTIKKIKNIDSDNKKVEILFVDDNSPDGTAKEVIRLSKQYKNVRLIQHGKKEGIGAALLFGCKYARGNLIIFLDADLSTDPEFILKMENLLNDGCDMVVGSRYLKTSSQSGKSYSKIIGSKFFNIFTKFVLGLPIKDITHSFRVFRKEVYVNIQKYIKEKGHPSFVIEFTYYAMKHKYVIKEFPITFIERDFSQGISKLNLKKELISSLKIILKLFLLK